MSKWINIKDELPPVGMPVKVLLTNGIETIDYVNEPINKETPFQHYLVSKWKSATETELTQYHLRKFNFCTDEHVNQLQEFIRENFTLDGTSKHLVGNILHYVSVQGEDAEETLNMLESLLDGIGITREEIINVVV